MPEPNEQFEMLTRVNVPELDAILGKPFKVLDDGFVRVVDYMGGDASVVQSARVSYGKGTKKVSEDRGLINYLMRHRHCYDDKTEVLTSDGFVVWPCVTAEQCLGIWDDKAQTLCYEKPEYLTCDDYEGQMYQVDHGGVSLLVTSEHSMWVKQRVWNGEQSVWTDRFGLVEASELGDKSMVRYSKLAPFNRKPDFNPYEPSKLFPECDSVRDLLRLIGFFIGDGSVSQTSTNCIEFHLGKERKKTFLREVVLGLGWELREVYDGVSTGGLSVSRFSVHAQCLGKVFRALFYAENGEKHIPKLLCHLNVLDSQAILDGLRNSDGTLKRGAWEYSTSVKDVAEKIQWIGLHAGEAVHIGSNDHGMYRLMFLSRMQEPVINQARRNTNLVRYSGKVYCAKTRTGVLVVRREGKIVLSGNTTPFEMAEIRFHIRIPMDAWRQMIRHRVANVNEYSTRYSIAIDEKQKTPPDKWRLQAKDNKQGSSGYLEEWPADEAFKTGNPAYQTPGEFLSQREQKLHEFAKEVYEERVDRFGIAKEQARKDLPLSTYTEAYWKCDLHNLLHFLGLRMEAHAQEEIRSYANVMGDIVKLWCPMAWDAFMNYRFNAVSFSALELQLLPLLIADRPNESLSLARSFGWLELKKGCEDASVINPGVLKENRERAEFEKKLTGLNVKAPWSF